MTQGIRDMYRHVAAIVSGMKAEDVPQELRAQVKMALFEAAGLIEPKVPDASAEQCLEKFTEILAKVYPHYFKIGVQDNREELLALLESLFHPEWRNAAPIDPNNWPMPLGIYDHFKGGVYKVRGVSTFASGVMDDMAMEEVVEYTSLTSGKDFTRFHWEWDELVKWPDGKYRARFVYRGPDLQTTEPTFKVKRS